MHPSRKVSFKKEKETLLITLYARALQSRSRHPILHDPWAAEAIQRIDYDFAKFKAGRRSSLLIAIRASQPDAWTRDFLAAHPDATELHLGCALDARYFRTAPPATVRWFEVDYPDVIDLRRDLYSETEAYRMIGTRDVSGSGLAGDAVFALSVRK